MLLQPSCPPASSLRTVFPLAYLFPSFLLPLPHLLTWRSVMPNPAGDSPQGRHSHVIAQEQERGMH